MPNIIGRCNSRVITIRTSTASEGEPVLSGAFNKWINSELVSKSTSNTLYYAVGLEVNASKSNSLYNKNTVTPLSRTCKYFIKY